MIQPRATLGPSLRVEADSARAFGLAQAEVDPSFPIRVVSAGLPFLLVPVKTREALSQARPNSAVLLELLERAPALGAMIYTLDSPARGALVSARMFAPLSSQVVEDPATGSAAGPLAAHLAECGVEAAFPGRSLSIRQGEDMGRTSVLECQVLGLADANEGVRVGGGVVVVGEGRMFVEG
jgi:trans-2,3-dihydro-3-hydroxyanthranilate isomerase